MSTDVYRAPKLPESPPLPPSELVYEAVDRDKNRGMLIAWFQLFSLPVLLGGVMATAVSPAVGLVVMIAAAGFSVWHRRRSAKRAGAVFRVEEGELYVFLRDCRTMRAHLRLRDLADVVLDVKTIRRVLDGDSPIPAVRFADTKVGPEVDTARIVLVRRKTKKNPNQLRLNLTDGYVAHMDATEWLGKIRVFLRKHGWVPLDERKKQPVSAEVEPD